ncbi:mitotic spindle assembly checkpoint protein MAD1-like [Tachyglossus aculeatus]|uniref:mitotic spindle assembly checkpoint protein MAD1-like n=1 Tax=Tachyglossus aculeatus TaxID=9261 RepID=UPI0018F34CBC|nr:mitotic spindle assembly checkpoint protein MAD1-like [Tachyglossus aculeatus]
MASVRGPHLDWTPSQLPLQTAPKCPGAAPQQAKPASPEDAETASTACDGGDRHAEHRGRRRGRVSQNGSREEPQGPASPLLLSPGTRDKERRKEGRECPSRLLKLEHSTASSTKKRLSEMTFHGLGDVNVSGILGKMQDYQPHVEDVTFLKRLKNQKEAETLKAKYLQLQKKANAMSQRKDLLVEQKEKIQREIQNMKIPYERAVQLGRAFLAKKTNPASVDKLAARAVLEQLDPVVLQHFQEEPTAQLQDQRQARNQLRRKPSSSLGRSQPHREKIRLEREICQQQIEKAEIQLQQAQEEVDDLKRKVEEVQSQVKTVQVCLNNTKAQISHLLALKERAEASLSADNEQEVDEDRLQRRLKRILHRKEVFLARERIIQKLEK